jgi:hypothetical protein
VASRKQRDEHQVNNRVLANYGTGQLPFNLAAGLRALCDELDVVVRRTLVLRVVFHWAGTIARNTFRTVTALDFPNQP